MMPDHARHNHDMRRFGNTDGSSSPETYAETTGTNTTNETVTIPSSLIAQQQAEESQNVEYPVAQEVIPPRPLGL